MSIKDRWSLHNGHLCRIKFLIWRLLGYVIIICEQVTSEEVVSSSQLSFFRSEFSLYFKDFRVSIAFLEASNFNKFPKIYIAIAVFDVFALLIEQ